MKRILWGKLVNAGQTCIAPDYILCSPEVQEKFLFIAKRVLENFYQSNPKESDSFARIINSKNFDRLKEMLNNTSGEVVLGGETDRDTCFITPTLVTNVSPSDPLMNQEIFGPIFPIVNVDSPEEAIDFINGREKPLTMYIFSNDKNVVKLFLEQTSSGSICINDCLMQSIGQFYLFSLLFLCLVSITIFNVLFNFQLTFFLHSEHSSIWRRW